jgi:hypothetical protein
MGQIFSFFFRRIVREYQKGTSLISILPAFGEKPVRFAVYIIERPDASDQGVTSGTVQTSLILFHAAAFATSQHDARFIQFHR